MNWPAGITTIPGHTSQSLNVSDAAATAVCVAPNKTRNSATTVTKRLIAYPRLAIGYAASLGR